MVSSHLWPTLLSKSFHSFQLFFLLGWKELSLSGNGERKEAGNGGGGGSVSYFTVSLFFTACNTKYFSGNEPSDTSSGFSLWPPIGLQSLASHYSIRNLTSKATKEMFSSVATGLPDLLLWPVSILSVINPRAESLLFDIGLPVSRWACRFHRISPELHTTEICLP